MDDEPNDQEGAEGCGPNREGRPDGQPFTQIVQPDAERHHCRQGQALLDGIRAAARLALRERVQQHKRPNDANPHDPDALKGAADLTRQFKRLAGRVDSKEDQQANRHCQKEGQPALAEQAQHR